MYLGVAARLGKFLLFLAVSIAVGLGLWIGFIKVFHLNPYFAKSPTDVWRYLTHGAQAGANRRLLWRNLGTTARDAALGYVFGTLAAVITAVIFVLQASIEQSLMPVAVALRSVPLVAMTPLLALTFGRGLLGVTIIAGIVTYFPTLVNMVQGLRAVPADSIALMRAYDASAWTTLRKVRLPCALPSLFASARIAGPSSLIGAVLAEWLATGKGLGALMLDSVSQAQYNTLWAGVVIITLVAVGVYAFVGLVETPVLARFSPNRGR